MRSGLASLIALVFAGLLGLAAAGALAQGPASGMTDSTTAPPPLKTITTAPAPDPAPTVPVPAPDPAPAAIGTNSSGEKTSPAPASSPRPAPAQPAPAVKSAAQPATRPVVHRPRSSARPTASTSGKRAVGTTRAQTLSATSFASTDSHIPVLYLLFAMLGLSIILLAGTPSPALGKTWIFKPLVDQRPHVAMAGTTVLALTAFAYLLQHWSP